MAMFAKKYPLARMAFDLATDSDGIRTALEQRTERLKKYYELMHGRCVVSIVSSRVADAW